MVERRGDTRRERGACLGERERERCSLGARRATLCETRERVRARRQGEEIEREQSVCQCVICELESCGWPTCGGAQQGSCAHVSACACGMWVVRGVARRARVFLPVVEVRTPVWIRACVTRGWVPCADVRARDSARPRSLGEQQGDSVSEPCGTQRATAYSGVKSRITLTIDT